MNPESISRSMALIIKRCADIAVAGLALLALLPVMAARWRWSSAFSWAVPSFFASSVPDIARGRLSFTSSEP